MKPKPLYRSMTFWFGILVIGFICLAWWDSRRVGRGMNIHQFGFVHAGNQLHITFEPDLLGQIWKPDFTRGGVPAIPVGDAFPKLDWGPIMVTDAVTSRPRRIGSILVIPHWLPLLAFALPWTGLLLLRARRIRRVKPTFTP